MRELDGKQVKLDIVTTPDAQLCRQCFNLGLEHDHSSWCECPCHE